MLLPALRSVLVEHTFEDLVKLEQDTEAERERLADPAVDRDAQWIRWRDKAAEFQAAVTVYAGREDVTESRTEVEQAVKKVVRHPEPEVA